MVDSGGDGCAESTPEVLRFSEGYLDSCNKSDIFFNGPRLWPIFLDARPYPGVLTLTRGYMDTWLFIEPQVKGQFTSSEDQREVPKKALITAYNQQKPHS